MATYNELIYDVLELIRNHQLSDDLDIDERQIVFQINTLRTEWIKNNLNKNGKVTDSNIESDLGCVKLILADPSECCNINSECHILRTEQKIPTFIKLNSGLAITRIGTINKTSIPFSIKSYAEIPYQSYNKYDNFVYTFYLNEYIYFITKNNVFNLLDYVNIRGILQDPTKAMDFNKCDGSPCFSYDQEYPMNTDMWRSIRAEILNTLSASMQIPKQVDNDAEDKVGKE